MNRVRRISGLPSNRRSPKVEASYKAHRSNVHLNQNAPAAPQTAIFQHLKPRRPLRCFERMRVRLDLENSNVVEEDVTSISGG